MAVVVRVSNIQLPSNVTHIATDYQVARDLLFTDIVLESLYDTNNLTTKIFNESLDPTISYYSRTRCYLNTGPTYWSNVDKFTPKDVKRIEFDTDMPSVLGLPRVTTGGNVETHPTTMFDINVSGFTAVGTATHEYTTYYITDLLGTVIWRRDKVDTLTSISVNDIVLKTNTVYRINVIFHASSGDVSQVGTTTIKTGINKNVNIITNLNDLNLDNDVSINLIKRTNVTYVDYSIINVTDGVTIVILEQTKTGNDMFTLIIPKNTLKLNHRYLLKCKTSLDTVYAINQFTTF